MNSCDYGAEMDKTIWVYKTRKDYSKHVPIELSADKTRVTSFSAYSDVTTKWPVKLTDGFFLNGSIGVNTGYTSLLKVEYSESGKTISADSLYQLLIDKDPFIEFYSIDDRNNVFFGDNLAFGIDTFKINELIRTNSLEDYFERLK